MSASETDGVRFSLQDGVARVTLDRPRVLNAVDAATHDRLNRIWAEIETDPSVRVVVITGAGDRAFSVGADMSAEGVAKTGLEYWADMDPNGFGGLSLRRTLDVPVIARVNGYALGGGLEMVLGADIVVAAEHAQLGLTEPRVGRLALDGGIALLTQRLPHTVAMGMLLTGRKATAAELHAAGLINEVVPAAELDAAVDRWVADILRCAPSSVRAVKQMVTRTAHLAPHEARAMLVPALAEALQGAEQDEGVRAFQEKRPPSWDRAAAASGSAPTGAPSPSEPQEENR
ncbi:enoyl-CoA hydratase-related protein [Cnuibacter physcomitrellae]|uniref:enoyl-CoA hydratase-related protein n=1 Tax=Cnuibacter physcomitrellae TaxID=1619308 RepID=UPI002175C72B|nr:enoyl-CoA hydratase-related protein [Cnuibacter physcomitrellae]MCS5497879.1 enoyl-CoA hydratase-related protein [Cnuibacter physcomitrellae]